jgi:hypothetical protein
VMLIAFLYTLVQHVVAGVVNHLNHRNQARTGVGRTRRARRRSPGNRSTSRRTARAP